MSAVLELQSLDVLYGSVPAVRGLNLEVGKGELRRLDRAERSRQVDHAARDHGRRRRRRPAMCASPASLCVAARRRRSPEPASRSCRRAGASSASYGRGEPPAWALGSPPSQRLGPARRGVRALPDARRLPRPPGRCPLGRPATAACDRPCARRGARRAAARRTVARACRRPSSTRCSPHSRRSATAASRSCSSSSARSGRLRSPNRTYVLANGELRMTLTQADADDTDKMIAAYLA